MDVLKEELENSKVQLKITLHEDDYKNDLNSAYRKIAGKYNFPGFRKGKAPASIIDARVGKAEVYEQMLNQSVGRYFLQALEDTKTDAVTRPDFEIESLGIDGDSKIVFSATFTVKPPVKLNEYKDLEIEIPKIVVEDKEIDEQVDQLRKKHSSLEKVDKAIAEGDFALVDYTVEVDGKIIERLSANDYLMEIDSGKIHENMFEALNKAKTGEIKEALVNFPNEYPETDLAGKSAKINVLIKEVKSEKLPELTDEFIQEISRFDTKAELTKDVTEKITEQKKQASELLTRSKIVEKVLEAAEVDIPSEIIEEQVNDKLERDEEALEKQGIRLSDYVAKMGSNMQNLRADYEKQAVFGIKRDLVLDAVAEKENIEITDEDLREELDRYSKALNKKPQEAEQMLRASGKFSELEQSIRMEKTLKFLAEHAKIKETEEKQDSKKSNKSRDKIEK